MTPFPRILGEHPDFDLADKAARELVGYPWERVVDVEMNVVISHDWIKTMLIFKL